MIIRTNLVNIAEKSIFPAQLTIKEGKIHSIEKVTDSNTEIKNYALCGFIDSHIHIESSMLVPSKFAQKAVVHGTVATVSDPHEIANVMGMEGVEFMVNDGNKVPFNFFFGAPSCVPATSFETAGATISVEDIEKLMSQPHIKYLSEMMNYPAVLARDNEVMAKIAAAQKYGKPTDGHAPGLRGEDAKNYIEAGMSTDHECFTAEEALDKLKYGMKIIIREGSAAKNFDALIGLLPEYYENMMFCSDDKHPDDLIEGHINLLVKRAIKLGIDKFKVLQVACINPIEHYNLEVGRLREGDKADFIIVKDLENFEVLETYINGEKVAENGKSFIKNVETKAINQFNVKPKKASDFEVKRSKIVGNSKENDSTITQIPVIEALDGQLITNPIFVDIDDLTDQSINNDGNLVSNLEKDILKMAVVNRYTSDAPIAIAFIKNFGLERGAIASCVAHDSHNIVAVGVTDEDLMKAVNLVIREKGGVSATSGQKGENENQVLPLPVAGIMSLEDGELVGKKYAQIDKFAKTLMTNPITTKKLHAPFMTLSFMALLVIPSLKLSDKGLFDGGKFEFVKGWEV